MKALRVLVAEDDTIVGMLLGELLKEMGHDVCAIEASEADAVAAAIRCKPDLMIIDVRLGRWERHFRRRRNTPHRARFVHVR